MDSVFNKDLIGLDSVSTNLDQTNITPLMSPSLEKAFKDNKQNSILIANSIDFNQSLIS